MTEKFGDGFLLCGMSFYLSDWTSIWNISAIATHSWRQPARVAREQARETDVGQTQPEHDDTVETDTTTSVWWTSIPESIDVVLETRRLWVDGRDALLHSSFEEFGVVDTLGA